MPKIGTIRGMLLEEVLLYLLRRSGYRTVEQVNSDDTLESGTNGLSVKGRGGKHQIDAIADSIVHHPFSHPQRLLLEAKFTGKTTGLPVVRNAIGVLKDVSEYWVTRGDTAVPARRYHYQYAVFSASGYSAPAEAYAFAQDIYLIPLAGSHYFSSILQSIQNLSEADFGAEVNAKLSCHLPSLRGLIRSMLKTDSDSNQQQGGDLVPAAIIDKLNAINLVCRGMDGALLAILGGDFPVFLVPAPGVKIDELEGNLSVRVYYDQAGWYVSSEREGREIPLFSFDLPKNLFNHYADGGHLSPNRALELKTDVLSDFQAFYVSDRRVRMITFRLDPGWLEGIREQLELS